RTLQTLSSARTRIEHDFDHGAITRLKESSDRDITIGGAALAGEAIAAGLVDECHLFLTPIVVGGGKRALPDNVRAQLELWAERRTHGLGDVLERAKGGARRRWAACPPQCRDAVQSRVPASDSTVGVGVGRRRLFAMKSADSPPGRTARGPGRLADVHVTRLP